MVLLLTVYDQLLIMYVCTGHPALLRRLLPVPISWPTPLGRRRLPGPPLQTPVAPPAGRPTDGLPALACY